MNTMSPKSISTQSSTYDSHVPLRSIDNQVVDHTNDDHFTKVHTKCNTRRMSLPSHLDSYQISDLLNPPRGIRDEMQRRGITPRDHHRDNRAQIAKISARNHALKQMPKGNIDLAITSQVNSGQCVQQQPRAKCKNGINYITRNVQSASIASKANPKVEHLDYLKKENFGKVPTYLVKRKVELAQDIERRLLENKNKHLPPGLVLMEDNDRVDVLTTLQSSKEKLEMELMNMPLVIQTSSQKRNKLELELQLQDLEKSIARFSRPKVYIRLKE